MHLHTCHGAGVRPYRIFLGWLAALGLGVLCLAVLNGFLPRGVCGSVFSPHGVVVTDYGDGTPSLQVDCPLGMQDVTSGVIIAATIGVLLAAAALVALLIARRSARGLETS